MSQPNGHSNGAPTPLNGQSAGHNTGKVVRITPRRVASWKVAVGAVLGLAAVGWSGKAVVDDKASNRALRDESLRAGAREDGLAALVQEHDERLAVLESNERWIVSALSSIATRVGAPVAPPPQQ